MKAPFTKLFFIFSTLCCSLGYGKWANKITNGAQTVAGEMPYQVSLQIDGSHVCGGSIFDEHHILTAAHCVLDERNFLTQTIKVLSRTMNQIFPKNGESRNIRLIVPHENYMKGFSSYDIAILVLEVPLQLDNYQKPIALAGKTFYLRPGDRVIASGWGISNNDRRLSRRLEKLETFVISSDECSVKTNRDAHSGVVCTQKTRGYSICKGDSGGPLVYDGVLVGIASQSTCTGNDPDIFTKVSSHIDWILETIHKYPR